jgi:hypothetical protein
MDIDPHTIQQILTKVREQLRCPQCRKKVEVDIESLKVLGDNFAVMQIKCDTCEAYIMLHATLSGDIAVTAEDALAEEVLAELETPANAKNVSTNLLMDENDLKKLRGSLKKANGSFMTLFEEEN